MFQWFFCKFEKDLSLSATIIRWGEHSKQGISYYIVFDNSYCVDIIWTVSIFLRDSINLAIFLWCEFVLILEFKRK